MVPVRKSQIVLIPAVFLGEFDHSLEVLRPYLISGTPRSQNVAATFSDNIDELFAVALNIFYRTYLQQGRGHIPLDANMILQDLLRLENICCVEAGAYLSLWKFEQILQA